MTNFFRAGFGFSIAVMTACSGSTAPQITSANDAGTTEASADQACTDSAHLRCTMNDSCTLSFYNKLHYGDEPTCEARLKAQCLTNLAASGTGQSPASIETCLTALAGESCATYLGDNPVAVCLPPVGQVANGGACTFAGQCQSTYCAVPQHAACGICADAPKAGDSCATTAECGARGGLVCQDSTCVAYALLGAACSSTMECGPGLSCVGATASVAGTCAAAGATLGAACDPKRKTAGGCDSVSGLYCATSDTCVAEPLVAGGVACGVLADDDTRCSAGGECIVATDGGTTGTCVAAAADGDACDTAVGPPCLAPARCIVSGAGTSGTCAELDPTKCM